MILEFRPDVAHIRNIYHQLSPSILWELKKQSVPVLDHLNDFKLLCPELQPGGSWAVRRSLQGWEVSAFDAGQVLSGACRASYVGGGGMCPSVSVHLRKMYRPVSRAKQICTRQVC